MGQPNLSSLYHNRLALAFVGAQLDWASGLTHIRQLGLILIRQVETVGPQDLNLLFKLHVVPST